MKNKQAVRIARDVLAQLAEKKILAKQGVYLKTPKPLEEGDLQKQLKKMVKPCTVCAIGSMFVAKVIRDDKYNVNIFDAHSHSVEDDEMRDLLDSAFDDEEMENIEAFFENNGDGDGGFEDDSIMDNVSDNLVKAEDRLTFIMKEIVRQKGEFDLDETEEHYGKIALKAVMSHIKKS